MGNYFGGGVGVNAGSAQRKRKHDDDDEIDNVVENEPKRVKLKSTSDYIYDTLFVNGENSDITICALGKEWHLHKVYLSQSCYFNSMFNGSWKESNVDRVELDVPDDNVTSDAICVALGSLYRDDVVVDANVVVPLLATACLFSLDDLTSRCAEVMTENVNLDTVCAYYDAGRTYGATSVTEKCALYLERKLMSNVSVRLLRQISIELMSRLVGSSDLFVMQVEMDVYAMVRKWVFLTSVDDWDGLTADLARATDEFVKTRATGNGVAWVPTLLENPAGATYLKIFRKLRYQHIVNDLASATALENDRIVPRSWLTDVYRQQWHRMLRVDRGVDLGPRAVDARVFAETSTRCGRVIHDEGPYCWRWTGYSYGIDILVSFDKRHVTLKRNGNGVNFTGALTQSPERHVCYRVNVASFRGDSDRVSFFETTDVQHVTLRLDEEVAVLKVDRRFDFPLYVGCNFLLYSVEPVVDTSRRLTTVATTTTSQQIPQGN